MPPVSVMSSASDSAVGKIWKSLLITLITLPEPCFPRPNNVVVQNKLLAVLPVVSMRAPSKNIFATSPFHEKAKLYSCPTMI